MLLSVSCYSGSASTLSEQQSICQNQVITGHSIPWFYNFQISFEESFWTATTRHGVTGKRSTKRLKPTGNLFRKNLQLMCMLIWPALINEDDNSFCSQVGVPQKLIKGWFFLLWPFQKWVCVWALSQTARLKPIRFLNLHDNSHTEKSNQISATKSFSGGKLDLRNS